MRIAHLNPPACSVCLQPPSVRTPQPRYVDFEVAYDGPVMTRHGDEVRAENWTPVSIDDLFICEECMKPAAELIGMVDGEQATAKIENLEAAVAMLQSEIQSKDRAISHMEATIRETIDHPIKRGHGKPTFKGPEDKEPELRVMRQNRALREKRGKARKGKVGA